MRYDAKPRGPHVSLPRGAPAAALVPWRPAAGPVTAFVLVKSEPGRDYAIVREWGINPGG